jgi:hypothetical protein
MRLNRSGSGTAGSPWSLPGGVVHTCELNSGRTCALTTCMRSQTFCPAPPATHAPSKSLPWWNPRLIGRRVLGDALILGAVRVVRKSWLGQPFLCAPILPRNRLPARRLVGLLLGGPMVIWGLGNFPVKPWQDRRIQICSFGRWQLGGRDFSLKRRVTPYGVIIAGRSSADSGTSLTT